MVSLLSPGVHEPALIPVPSRPELAVALELSWSVQTPSAEMMGGDLGCLDLSECSFMIS